MLAREFKANFATEKPAAPQTAAAETHTRPDGAGGDQPKRIRKNDGTPGAAPKATGPAEDVTIEDSDEEQPAGPEAANKSHDSTSKASTDPVGSHSASPSEGAEGFTSIKKGAKPTAEQQLKDKDNDKAADSKAVR